MKIFAYTIDGLSVGFDIKVWTNDILSGNTAFLLGEDIDSPPSGYTDVSSIISWGTCGENLGLNYVQIRNEMKIFLPATGLTQQEINILTEYNLYNYYMIYDYISDGTTIISADPPTDVDYDILGLFKKRTIVKGELTKVEYYGEYNSTGQTYSRLVVSEDRVYKRINQMANRREMKIKWYLSDGSVGYEKDTLKYYSNTEAMVELDTRRSNIISELKINTVGLIMMCSGVTSIQAQAIGKPLLSTYSAEITKYVQGYEQELRDAIANDSTYQYLTCAIPGAGGLTIRQYLIAGLTIDYSVNNINT